MPFFRKKPVTIEAHQWHRHGDHPEVEGIPFHVHNNVDGVTHGWIQTLEGGHIVSPGDWIIKGVKGEFYPCKPGIFDATYYEVAAPHDAKESNPKNQGAGQADPRIGETP